jgi:hypothetical protein
MKDPFKKARRKNIISRKVSKGFDPINEVVSPGYKSISTRFGPIKREKNVLIDDEGLKRKKVDTYVGYSHSGSITPDNLVKRKVVKGKDVKKIKPKKTKNSSSSSYFNY